jgi:carbon starvation protein
MVLMWGYFIWTGNISTIWPLFGVSNQLLASVALAVGTTMLINMGRAKLALVTLLPLSFLSVTTLTAGYLSIRDNFWPLTKSPVPATYVQGYVDSIAMGIMLVCAVIIFAASIRRWVLVISGKIAQTPELAEA